MTVVVNTRERYLEELHKDKPWIEAYGSTKYIDMSLPMTHHCLKHDVIWEVTPLKLLTKPGCSMCAKEAIKRQRMQSLIENERIEEMKRVEECLKQK